MNADQQGHLLRTFQHIDDLLIEAEAVLVSTRAESLFERYVRDASDVQRKLTHESAERIRGIMRRTLDEFELAPAPSPCSALWAVRGQMNFALTTIAEIGPERMSQYGELSQDTALKLNAVVTELRSAVEQMDECLA
jgi:hypothetical protein